MRVELSEPAQLDLDTVKAYFEITAPGALQGILDDIAEVFVRLEVFPHSGTWLSDKEVRRSVSRRHRFVVYYTTQDDLIVIRAIFRYQNR